jgi:hypothetical protein
MPKRKLVLIIITYLRLNFDKKKYLIDHVSALGAKESRFHRVWLNN